MDKHVPILGCSKRSANEAAGEARAGGIPSGAHGATNKEHHVCARRRVSEAAGSPLRILKNRKRRWGTFSASCYGFHPDNTHRCAISGVKLPTSSETLVMISSANPCSSKHS